MASGVEIFRLFGSIFVESSEAEKNLKAIGEKAKDFAGTLGKGILKAGEWAAAVGTAAAGAAVGLAVKTAEAADHIDKMSQKIGISTDAYQEWAFIMDHCGANVDGLQAGMKTLSAAVEGGSKKTVEAFDKIGLSMDDISSLSQEQLFSAVINGLQGMEAGTERTAVASALLGKAATDLAPLLNTSAEATEEMRLQVHELGGVMSADAVAAGAAFEDALANLKTVAGGVGKNLAGEFLPAVVKVMNGVVAVVSGDHGGLAEIREGIKEFLRLMSEMIPPLLDVATEMMLQFLDIIVDNLPAIIEMGITIILKLIAGILEAIPKLVVKVPDIIRALVNGFTAAWPEIQKIGSDIVDKIIDGVAGAAGRLWQKVSELASSAASSIKGIFSNAAQMELANQGYNPQGGSTGSSGGSGGGVNVTQNFYGGNKSAADQQREARWALDGALG